MPTFLVIVSVTFLLLVLVFAVIIVVALGVVRGNTYSPKSATATSKSLFNWLKEYRVAGEIIVLGIAFGLTMWLLLRVGFISTVFTNLALVLAIAVILFSLTAQSPRIGIAILSAVSLLALCFGTVKSAKKHGYLSKPSATVAREVVYPRLKPVGQFAGEKRFIITAPPGDPNNLEAWSEEVVIPYGCSYNFHPEGPVWYMGENYVKKTDGPPSLSYPETHLNPSLHHFWFLAQGEKPVIVKVEILSPGHH